MKIPIQNIYFLLCYAWNTLAEGRVVSVSQEECKTLAELFAHVLDGGVTHLLKRGLDRDYVTEEVDTSSLRGSLHSTMYYTFEWSSTQLNKNLQIYKNYLKEFSYVNME